MNVLVFEKIMSHLVMILEKLEMFDNAQKHLCYKN